MLAIIFYTGAIACIFLNVNRIPFSVLQRNPEATIKAGFTVFEEIPVVQEACTMAVASSNNFEHVRTELNSKENVSSTSKRRKSRVNENVSTSTLPGVVTITVPVERNQLTNPPVRRSSRSCGSFVANEIVQFVDTKEERVENNTIATTYKKRTRSESTAVISVEPNDSVVSVVEGKASIVECDVSGSAEARPERKKICSALTRTVPKRNLNPAKCLDIIDRMYKNYYDLEAVYTAKPYLDNQKDINAKMRAILVDWIVEVHYKFKLQQATLWLCINIIDRFLESTPIMRADLQLVGVSALLIACKFEEIYPPEVRDCIYITDYAYTREQVLAMESKILCGLDYHICVPTGYHFMIRYLNSFNASEQVKYLSFYYAERNLQEYDMLSMRPNKFAATALYAALSFRPPEGDDTFQAGHPPDNPWTAELETLTGFSKADLLLGAFNILRHVQEETVTASKRQLIAAKKKYAAEKYNAISALPVPQLIHQSTPVLVASSDSASGAVRSPGPV